jgi:hypothetical protein
MIKLSTPFISSEFYNRKEESFQLLLTDNTEEMNWTAGLSGAWWRKETKHEPCTLCPEQWLAIRYYNVKFEPKIQPVWRRTENTFNWEYIITATWIIRGIKSSGDFVREVKPVGHSELFDVENWTSLFKYQKTEQTCGYVVVATCSAWAVKSILLLADTDESKTVTLIVANMSTYVIALLWTTLLNFNTWRLRN